MKKLSKLKLNQLSDANLRDREMNGLRGGGTCACSCYYENSGGSSSSSNRDANCNTGPTGIGSPVGCNQYQVVESYYYHYCGTCTEWIIKLLMFRTT